MWCFTSGFRELKSRVQHCLWFENSLDEWKNKQISSFYGITCLALVLIHLLVHKLMTGQKWYRERQLKIYIFWLQGRMIILEGQTNPLSFSPWTEEENLKEETNQQNLRQRQVRAWTHKDLPSLPKSAIYANKENNVIR